MTARTAFTSHMAGPADPLMEELAHRLGMRWCDGSWDERLAGLRDGAIGGGWMCGLLYAQLAERGELTLVPVAAPVMAGERYGDRPVYFGDLVVRADSDVGSLDDLADATVAYNETASLSGYRMLLDRFGSLDGFGAAIASGSHAASIQLVEEGVADVASIDSTLLDMLVVRRPSYASRLRVVASLGPYPAPPAVAAPSIATEMRARLVELPSDPAVAAWLESWGIRRFAAVSHADYAALVEGAVAG